MTMDPGTRKTGWCIMDPKTIHIVDAGMLTSMEDHWLKNCQRIWPKVINVFYKYNPKMFLYEIPEHWKGVQGGSAEESGSVGKLQFFCGGVHALMSPLVRDIRNVTPSGWKGQMDKDMIRRRLMRRMPSQAQNLEKLNHNIVDAIGIAYWWIEEGKNQ